MKIAESNIYSPTNLPETAGVSAPTEVPDALGWGCPQLSLQPVWLPVCPREVSPSPGEQAAMIPVAGGDGRICSSDRRKEKEAIRERQKGEFLQSFSSAMFRIRFSLISFSIHIGIY